MDTLMKLLVILLCLLPLSVLGMNAAIVGGGGRAPGYVGDKTDYSPSYTTSGATGIICIPYTSNKSGTAGYANIRIGNAGGGASIQMCLFSSDGDAPDVGDIIVGSCVDVPGTNTTGLKTSASKITGNVTLGNTYWLCYYADGSTQYPVRTTSGTKTVYSGLCLAADCMYNTLTNSQIDGTWSAVADRDFSVWVDID